MNSPNRQLRDLLGRMADEAPEPIPFDDLGVYQLQPTDRSTGWLRRPASVLVLAVVSVLVVGLFSVIVFGPGGDSQPAAPSFEGRTYYESLDLSSPESAVQTFTGAFAADDFMTVWFAFDAGAQREVQDHFSMGAYDQLVDYDRFPGEVVESSPFPRLSDWESWDEWWMFDHLMLQANTHDAFLIDLSGSVTVTAETTLQDEAVVRAEVDGVDGQVTFRLSESSSGRWRINQVFTSGGDPEAVPWGSGDGEPLAAGEVGKLPADHAAAEILAITPTFNGFAELAQTQDREFVCGASGGPTPWEVCLVLDDGLLAVVPFATSPGLMGTVESPELAELTVVALDGEAIAVRGIELSVTVTITHQGEQVGSISGP